MDIQVGRIVCWDKQLFDLRKITVKCFQVNLRRTDTEINMSICQSNRYFVIINLFEFLCGKDFAHGNHHVITLAEIVTVLYQKLASSSADDLRSAATQA